MLLLFSDRKAEVAELSSEGKVFSVSECHKSALLEIELSLAVYKAFVRINADNFGKEHRMRAEELFFCNSAFKTQRTFLYQRRSYLLRRNGMESAECEFVGIFSAFYAADICFTAHSGGSKIDDKFA